MVIHALGLIVLAVGVSLLCWWFKPPMGDSEPVSEANLEHILRQEFRKGDGPTL